MILKLHTGYVKPLLGGRRYGNKLQFREIKMIFIGLKTAENLLL